MADDKANSLEPYGDGRSHYPDPDPMPIGAVGSMGYWDRPSP